MRREASALGRLRALCRRPSWVAAVVVAAGSGAVSVAYASAAVSRASTTGHAKTVARASSGGVIKLGVASAFNTLDPMPFGAKNYWTYGSIYDTALTMKGSTPVPGLVQSWKVAKNDRWAVLFLRKGVKYSDGTPFNAKALVWNINWQKQPATGAHGYQLWQQVTAKVKSTYTVKLTFKYQTPEIFSMLAQAPVIKPLSSFASTTGPWVGTGPFKVTNFTPGTSLTAVPNPHYWQKGEPKASGFQITNYANPATAELALKAGTINIDSPMNIYSDVSDLRSAGDKVLLPKAKGLSEIEVKTTTPPLNNPNVREALSLAFDRVAFAKMQAGINKPLYSAIPPGVAEYDKKLDTGSYSLSKAKALLAKAHVSHLTLTIDSANVLPTNEFLPVYQQALASIGVTLNINTITAATWSQEAATGSFKDLLSQGVAGSDYDPAQFFGTPANTPYGNTESFSSKKYRLLMNTANRAKTPSIQAADYAKVVKFIQQQNFLIPLSTFTWVTAYAPSVSNVTPGFANSPIWGQVSVS